MQKKSKEIIIVNLDRTLFNIHSLNDFIRENYLELNKKIVFTVEVYKKMLDKLEFPVDQIIYNDENYYFNVVNYIKQNKVKKSNVTFINPPKVFKSVLIKDSFNIVEVINLCNY